MLRLSIKTSISSFLSLSLRLLSYFPVLIILCLISLPTFAVNRCLFPFLLKSAPLAALLLLALFNPLVGLVLAALRTVVSTDPGAPPADWSDRVEYDGGERRIEEGQFKHKDLMWMRDGDGQRRRCGKCRIFKPDRCHHCRICDKCVLKMDHHCGSFSPPTRHPFPPQADCHHPPMLGAAVFLNNCVGFRNHKAFLLFLFYATLACITLALFGAQTFLAIFAGRRRDIPHYLLFTIAYLISATFAVSLAIFTSLHLHFLLTNCTTLEQSTPSPPAATPANLGPARNFR